MANAWITQYRASAVVNNVAMDIPLGLPLRTEKVAFTDTSATSAAIGDDCGLVAISVDTPACFAAGLEATAEDEPIGMGTPTFIVPTDRSRFSFIALQPPEEPEPEAQFTPQLFLLLMGS